MFRKPWPVMIYEIAKKSIKKKIPLNVKEVFYVERLTTPSFEKSSLKMIIIATGKTRCMSRNKTPVLIKIHFFSVEMQLTLIYYTGFTIGRTKRITESDATTAKPPASKKATVYVPDVSTM